MQNETKTHGYLYRVMTHIGDHREYFTELEDAIKHYNYIRRKSSRHRIVFDRTPLVYNDDSWEDL